MNINLSMMQVRHGAVLIYNQWQGNRSKSISLRRALNMRNQQRHQYGGRMSPGAKKRLAKACTLLVQSAKPQWIYNDVSKKMVYHKLSFITLTVSDPAKKLTGKDAYKHLLSHFMAWLRRTLHCNTYLWKAELQRNGQIHYHITTPHFVNYQKIRDKWNNLQKKAGLLESYHAAKGHYDANSTDVHEVMNVKDVAAYLIKYISKESQNEQSLGGKVWDCSQNLKSNKYFSVELDTHHDVFIQSAVAEKIATSYTGNHFTIIKFTEPVTERLLKKWELKQYKVFCQKIRDGEIYEWQPPPGAKDFGIHLIT